jgi:hypothetical protein
MQWYYVLKGKRQGPVEVDQLKELIEQGTLTSQTKVWNPEMGHEWKRIGVIPELASKVQDPGPDEQPPEPKRGLRFTTTIRQRRRDHTSVSRGNVEFASLNTMDAAKKGASFKVTLRQKSRWWYIVAGLVLIDFLMMHFKTPIPKELGALAGMGFLEYAYALTEGNQLPSNLAELLYWGAPLVTIAFFCLTGFLGQRSVLWLYLISGLILIGDMAWLLQMQEWVAAIIHALVLHPLIAGYAAGMRYKVRAD